MKDTLIRLQNSLIEATKPTRETNESSAFTILLTPSDPLVWLNYAVPTTDATTDQVDEMISVFRQADRTPRLEFFADLWPQTIVSLENRGFVCEKQMPIMVMNHSEWQGLNHSHDVRPVDASSYHEFNGVLQQAFGMASGVSEPNQIDPLDDPTFQRIACGATLASAAFVNGKVVGGGLGVGTPEIREIAGIGTDSQYRKQGIASAVIAHLLDQFFQNGGEIAWLTPGDDSAQSVYSNLGFQSIAEQVVYGLPNLSDAK